MSTRLLIATTVVCLITGCGGSRTAVTTTTDARSSRGFAIKPPAPAPPFLLRDQNSQQVGPQLYRGHWMIVTFLYTHCPDVCPLITGQLAAAQRQKADLRVIAVSVDPARDTTIAIRRFLATHHTGRHFRYVTGPRSALERVWRLYHIAALPGPKGTVSHSAISLLVDPSGRERTLFDSHLTAAQLLRAITQLH